MLTLTLCHPTLVNCINLPLSLIEHKGAVTGRLLPLFPLDKWSNSLAAWNLYSWLFCHYWQRYLTGPVACIRIPFLKVKSIKLTGTNTQYSTFTIRIHIIYFIYQCWNGQKLSDLFDFLFLEKIIYFCKD